MNERIKTSVVVFLICAVLYCLINIENTYNISGSLTAKSDYARITDVEYKAIVIDEDIKIENEQNKGNDFLSENKKRSGTKIAVTERITFDIHAASKDNPFWEVWLGLGEEKIDGLRRIYDVKSVAQIMPDGTKVQWEEAPKLYWNDKDYINKNAGMGPNKWYHSQGPYSEASRRYECLMFYIDGVYRDTMTFEIEYDIFNSVFSYADCAELYIPMYSGEECKHLNSFKGEILIANKDMPDEKYSVATGFGTKNGAFELEKSTSKNEGYTTFSFDLDEKELKFINECLYLEFDMYAKGEDKHKFADFAPENIYSDQQGLDEVVENRNHYLNLPKKRNREIMTVYVITAIASVLIIVKVIKKLKAAKKHCNVNKKCDTIYREIPSDLDPHLAATLVFCKETKDVAKDEEKRAATLAALMLSLARKKYISLEERYSETVIRLPNTEKEYGINGGENIEEMQEEREPLTYCEQQYYNLILRHHKKGSIPMSSLRQRISMDDDFAWNFQQKINNADIDKGQSIKYTTKNPFTKHKHEMLWSGLWYILIGVCVILLGDGFAATTTLGLSFMGFNILGLTAILAGVYLRKQARYYVCLTDYGEQEYQKWRGLYNFLKSDTLLNERGIIELSLWEKYLVYATAFDISEKVVEAIKIRCPQTPEITSIANTSTHNISHIRISSSHMHSGIRSASTRHTMSHYGSSYSAGSRGGIGGGGGGH